MHLTGSIIKHGLYTFYPLFEVHLWADYSGARTVLLSYLLTHLLSTKYEVVFSKQFTSH